MPDAKIEIKVGSIEFSGEGEQTWVAEQLDKILDKADCLMKFAPPVNDQPPNHEAQESSSESEADNTGKPLGAFLREKNAVTNQVQKFLVTAIWLHQKGHKRLRTNDVTTALRDNSQTKIGNPSRALASNITKGHCEKAGNKFFVTDEGKRSI